MSARTGAVRARSSSAEWHVGRLKRTAARVGTERAQRRARLYAFQSQFVRAPCRVRATLLRISLCWSLVSHSDCVRRSLSLCLSVSCWQRVCCLHSLIIAGTLILSAIILNHLHYYLLIIYHIILTIIIAPIVLYPYVNWMINGFIIIEVSSVSQISLWAIHVKSSLVADQEAGRQREDSLSLGAPALSPVNTSSPPSPHPPTTPQPQPPSPQPPSTTTLSPPAPPSSLLFNLTIFQQQPRGKTRRSHGADEASAACGCEASPLLITPARWASLEPPALITATRPGLKTR